MKTTEQKIKDKIKLLKEQLTDNQKRLLINKITYKNYKKDYIKYTINELEKEIEKINYCIFILKSII